MSRTLPIKVNPVESVSAGQEAWVKLSNGPTYQQLLIESNIPPAEMEKISVDLGGVHDEGIIFDALGTELITKDKYKGKTVPGAAPYFYMVEFGQLDGKTDGGQMYSGLVTLPTDNIRLLFDLADELTPGAPYIKVSGYASASQPVRTFIPYLRPQTIIVNETGTVTYSSLPTKKNLHYRRLWLFGGGLTQVELYKDGGRQYHGVKASVEYMQKYLELVPQSGVWVVDFVERGFVLMDLYDPKYKNEQYLEMQAGTAENIRCLVEGVRRLNADQYQK